MRHTTSVALATWIVQRLTPLPHSDALLGDLLEELDAGRPITWFLSQVISVLATQLVAVAHSRLRPIAFSAAWSLAFPAWQLFFWNGPSVHALFNRWSSLDWPYSTILAIAEGILPAVSFTWLGLILYLGLQPHRTRKLSSFRLLCSLSLSLNVLLVATMSLTSLSPSGRPHIYPSLGQEIFQVASLRPILSVPLTLSLLSAIFAASPSRPTSRRAAAPTS